MGLFFGVLHPGTLQSVTGELNTCFPVDSCSVVRLVDGKSLLGYVISLMVSSFTQQWLIKFWRDNQILQVESLCFLWCQLFPFNRLPIKMSCQC